MNSNRKFLKKQKSKNQAALAFTLVKLLLIIKTTTLSNGKMVVLTYALHALMATITAKIDTKLKKTILNAPLGTI